MALPRFGASDWLVSHASGAPQVSTLQPLPSTTSLAGQATCQSWHHVGRAEVAARTRPDTQQSFYRDLLAVLLVFPLPRAPWPQPAALPHAGTAGRSCGPRVVFPGIICTSLLFICVLQAPCVSRPLVYTGNHHKSLPKGAASRQIPAASRPQQERACGYQPDPHSSRCKRDVPPSPSQSPGWVPPAGWDTGMLSGWESAKLGCCPSV